MTEDGRPTPDVTSARPPTTPLEPGPPPLEPAPPAGPASPEAPATLEPGPPPSVDPIPLATTRGLIAASFDLLTRSGNDMRRASFYIGAIVLGTIGPFALASFALDVVALEMTFTEYQRLLASISGLLASLGLLAFIGLVVAAVESRTMAVAVLGGRMAERPVSIRRALARSRQTFWRAIVASIVASVPVLLAQGAVNSVVEPLLGPALEASVITSTLVSAVVGAPFAYLLAGVVLGDVDPFEALRRSFMVFRARKLAASMVAVFETITALLLILGISVGLDVVLRALEAFGLGAESGTVGLSVTIVAVVAIVFAFGTLLFTVMALTIAPQVVMFVGLTHAIVGLDRVRAGGRDDPDQRRPGVFPFRWLTRLMLLGFALGALGLGLTIVTIVG